jgi:hypothetical protein
MTIQKMKDGFILFMKTEDSKLQNSIITAQKMDESCLLKGEPLIVCASQKTTKTN